MNVYRFILAAEFIFTLATAVWLGWRLWNPPSSTADEMLLTPSAILENCEFVGSRGDLLFFNCNTTQVAVDTTWRAPEGLPQDAQHKIAEKFIEELNKGR